MAKITKTYPSNSIEALAKLKGLKASFVLIDGTEDKTVYDHILDSEVHLTKEEKEALISGVGAGLSEEDYNRILDLVNEKANKEYVEGKLSENEEYLESKILELMELINSKADSDYDYSKDADFQILASQVIENVDRKFVSASEKSALSGVSGNIQLKLNEISSKIDKAMYDKGIYETYAEMGRANADPTKGSIVFIRKDETDSNSKTIYIHNGSAWVRVFSSYISELSASVIKETADKKFINSDQKDIVSEMGVHEITGSLTFKGEPIGGGGAAINDSVISEITSYSSSKTKSLLDLKQDVLKYTPENAANREKANGYAGLDSAGLIQLSRIPKEALHRTYLAMNAERRLALTSTSLPGDYVYETSTGKLFIKLNTTSTNLDDHWNYIADSFKLNQLVTNKLNATEAPTPKDDNLAGYSVGSIWIDVSKKRSYICTSSETNLAIWDLMGGQITLSANEVIPFLYDENREGAVDGQTQFLLPKYVEGKSTIDVFVNSNKLIEGQDYVIVEGSSNLSYYVELTQGVGLTDVVSGYVYQMGGESVVDYMTKSIYDSDNDGVVDKAEIASFTETLLPWESGKLYSLNDLILNDGAIYRAKSNFKSEMQINMDNWELVKTEPYSLGNFNTSHLKEDTDKLFVTRADKDSISKIPATIADLNNLKLQANNSDSRISTIRAYIPSNTSSTNTLVNSSTMNNRFSDLKLKDLNDTHKTYIKDGFLKVNSSNTGIEYVADPRFPIMKITDRRNDSYQDIYDLKIQGFEKKTFEDGILTIEPKIRSSELIDMPEININGGILISNQNNSSYELINPKLLTMSQENKTKIIIESDWVEVTSGEYEFEYTHDLASEALVISFTNSQKEELLDVTYKIIDASNVVFKTKKRQLVNVTINCSLGVTNGYWSHLFDFSKISFVNDVEPKIDKSYSSDKIEKLIAPLAQKSNVFTKQEVSNSFASKTSEHLHSNLDVLNKFEEDSQGNVTYLGKALLSDIKGRMLSFNYDIDNQELTEIININSIIKEEDINSIISTEIVIQNTSDEKMELMVKDGDIVLISEKLDENQVQKYNLGVSTLTKVYVKGIGKINYHMSIL